MCEAFSFFGGVPTCVEANRRVDLPIVDGLGSSSFGRGGAELLFRVFAERYEWRSLPVTGNLPFGEWGRCSRGSE